jgi:hypothetical protein
MDINKKVDLIEAVLGVKFDRDDIDTIKSAITLGDGNLALGVRCMMEMGKVYGWNECDAKHAIVKILNDSGGSLPKEELKKRVTEMGFSEEVVVDVLKRGAGK